MILESSDCVAWKSECSVILIFLQKDKMNISVIEPTNHNNLVKNSSDRHNCIQLLVIQTHLRRFQFQLNFLLLREETLLLAQNLE